MKRLKNILIALSVVSLTGCDYLDIVPDEQTTEYNMYDTPTKAKNYLNACYGYIPNSRASEALDKMTGLSLPEDIIHRLLPPWQRHIGNHVIMEFVLAGNSCLS